MSTVFALQPPVVSQTFQRTCPGAQAAAWSVYVTTDIAAMTVVNAKASAITAKIFVLLLSRGMTLPEPAQGHCDARHALSFFRLG
jgi:hypothetical protein